LLNIKQQSLVVEKIEKEWERKKSGMGKGEKWIKEKRPSQNP
jgi:hypothetical protein